MKGKEILIIGCVNEKIEYIDLNNHNRRHEIELMSEFAYYTKFLSLKGL